MAPLSYRIRQVDGEDESDTLTELHRACFTTYDAPAELVDFDEGFWWIATCRGAPAAFIGIKESASCDSTGYFIRVGVTPEHRGHKLQRRLMQAMHQKARKLGWSTIVTDTRNNPHSANNIIAAGYRMFLPEEPWSFNDASYWKKDL